MKLKDYSVLGLNDVFGNGKLDVFNRYGSEAEVTDYVISRGVEFYPLKEKDFIEKKMKVQSPVLNKNICDYWTSSKAGDHVSKFYTYGRLNLHADTAWSDNNGVRIAVPFEQIKDEIESSYTEDFGKGEVTTVIFGEYPQSILGLQEKIALNKLYENKELESTDKYYSAWGNRNELFYDGAERTFERDEYPEFKYNGMKFVRAKKSVFENGSDRIVWSIVEPVEWIIDEKSGLAITKKCIIGGIPLNRKGILLGNFDHTLVQEFIVNEFSKDILNKDFERNNKFKRAEFLDNFGNEKSL